MSKLLPFPDTKGGCLPKPVNYQPGAEYEFIELDDDSLIRIGLYPGTCFTVLKGVLWDRLIHAVEIGGVTYLGAVEVLDGRTVKFVCWQKCECGVHQLNKINVLGVVCEVFPFGEEGPRWVLHQNTAAKADNFSHGRLLRATV